MSSLRCAALVACGLAAWLMAGCGVSAQQADPLAAEIRRWSAIAADTANADELMREVAPESRALLAAAEDALGRGYRLLALQRLARARMDLSAATYAAERVATGDTTSARFSIEWRRMAGVLQPDRLAASSLDGVHPAGVRALAEAALPQVKIYYEASLEYGENTMPLYGLFYLGAARAQREMTDFIHSLKEGPAGTPPPLRTLGPELDALEAELLAIYRPPFSIDRHAEFITASSALKEARELDSAGLRHGALLRLLQTSLRVAPLRGKTPVLDSAVMATRIRQLETRLSGDGTDHSIARLLLESARAEIEGGAQGAPLQAATIVMDVVPRYFAALEPAPVAKALPPAEVTVTLVRWPYT